MTPKGRLAIAAAEQAGRVLGARAAHSALRSLVLTLHDRSDRLSALLAAAQHATQLRDEAALLSLTVLLADIEGPAPADYLRALAALTARLRRERRHRVAIEFARAEVRRAPRAEAYYLLGRCLHASAPDEAEAAYRAAEAQPGGAPSSLVDAARHQRRLLALTQRTPAPLDATSSAASTRHSAARSDARHALSDAAARLSRGGRYARALAIDQLADLARDTALHRDLRHSALRLLARYADDMAPALGPVETERLSAAFDGQDPALGRALRLRLAWNDEAHEPALALATRPNAAQDIACLLAREAFSDAAGALRRARVESHPTDAPASLYAAAWLSACAADSEVAREGVALLDALLELNARPPHGGFLRLSRALEPLHPALARRALERAATRHEAGATAALGALLVADAWTAYARGDREAALGALRRADRLNAEPSVAAPP